MRIEQLRYFVEIAHGKSMSIAAENQYITQPALSRAIKLLEEELGLTLFSRTVRGVQLTFEGEQLYPDALEILQNIDKFTITAKTLTQRTQADNPVYLTILTFSTLADALLPLTLEKFKRQCPHVKIQVCTLKLTDFNSIPDLTKFDLIILNNILDILDQLIIQSHLYQEHLFVENYFLVVHQSHELVNQTHITLSDVFNYKVIVPQNGLPVEKLFENLLHTKKPLEPLMQSNNTRIITQALTTQNAVLISTNSLVERDYANHSALRILPLKNIKGQCFALYSLEHPQIQIIQHLLMTLKSARLLDLKVLGRID